MQHKPLVSIITVCLNSEKTIEQTIQSVVNQSYDNIEYIIVDGLSTDGTLTIVDKYRRNISALISEKDNGLYDAMNKGIEIATGELIGILNSDDYYLHDTVKIVVERYLQSTNSGVFYGNIRLLNEHEHYEYILNAEENPKNLLYKMVVPHPSAFVKKSVYQQYGCFSLEYKIASDREFMLRVFTSGVNFCYINHVLTVMRLDGLNDKAFLLNAREAKNVSLKYNANKIKVFQVYFYDIIKRLIRNTLERFGLKLIVKGYKMR